MSGFEKGKPKKIFNLSFQGTVFKRNLLDYFFNYLKHFYVIFSLKYSSQQCIYLFKSAVGAQDKADFQHLSHPMNKCTPYYITKEYKSTTTIDIPASYSFWGVCVWERETSAPHLLRVTSTSLQLKILGPWGTPSFYIKIEILYIDAYHLRQLIERRGQLLHSEAFLLFFLCTCFYCTVSFFGPNCSGKAEYKYYKYNW